MNSKDRSSQICVQIVLAATLQLSSVELSYYLCPLCRGSVDRTVDRAAFGNIDRAKILFSQQHSDFLQWAHPVKF